MCGSASSAFSGSTGWFDKILSGLTVASSVATTAQGFMPQKTHKVSAAPKVVETSTEEAATLAKRQRALAARTRQRSTSLTGGLGVQSPANTALKTLFGGN
jgi:hypothetical protein